MTLHNLIVQGRYLELRLITKDNFDRFHWSMIIHYLISLLFKEMSLELIIQEIKALGDLKVNKTKTNEEGEEVVEE